MGLRKLPHCLKSPHTHLTLSGSGGRGGNDRKGSGLRGLIWILETGAARGTAVEKRLRVIKKWSVTESTDNLPIHIASLCLHECSLSKAHRMAEDLSYCQSFCHHDALCHIKTENFDVWYSLLSANFLIPAAAVRNLIRCTTQ